MVAENSVVVCCVAKKRCRKVRDWRSGKCVGGRVGEWCVSKI